MNKNSRAALGLLLIAVAGAATAAPSLAPEFTHRDSAAWLNSVPLKLVALRGKVVLVEFWTFDRINCLRSLPWMQATATAHSSDDLGP